MKRSNTVKAVKDMTMEEKKKYLLARQDAEKRARKRASMQKHFLDVRNVNVNAATMALAEILTPMIYIKMVDRIVYFLAMAWLVKGVEKKLGEKAWFIRAICMPFNILSLIISIIFIKPVFAIRKVLVNAGIKCVDEEINARVTIRRIYKWGKMIDESRWEA
jgi:DNA-directed RNA polymerase subunit K/omega